MDNDYFKEGAERAVARMEAAGYVLPPMDLEQYSKANVEASNAQVARPAIFYRIQTSYRGLTMVA